MKHLAIGLAFLMIVAVGIVIWPLGNKPVVPVAANIASTENVQDRREWCFSRVSASPYNRPFVVGVDFFLIANDHVHEHDPLAIVLLEGLRVELKEGLLDVHILFPEPILPWERSPSEFLYDEGWSHRALEFSSAILLCPNEELRAKWQGWIDVKLKQTRLFLYDPVELPISGPPEEKK